MWNVLEFMCQFSSLCIVGLHRMLLSLSHFVFLSYFVLFVTSLTVSVFMWF